MSSDFVSRSRLCGGRFLVLEDEPLLAMEIETSLYEAGAAQIYVAHALGDADLERGDIEAAILDLKIRGESSVPLALKLMRRGVFVMYISGYADAAFPPALNQTPRLPKPVDFERLIRTLANRPRLNA